MQKARSAVMGVLNVTPDSFSDGGRYLETANAVRHGREMFAEGADVVDVGGESSRPGADVVPEPEELRRVLPVVEELAEHGRVSVDTVKPEVARRAVAVGASLINDVSGSLWPVAAETGAGWVAMHMRGTPRDMQRRTGYEDVVAEVEAHLEGLARRAAARGVAEVWWDPGIGFAKTAGGNVELLAELARIVGAAERHGHRVLVGTSRKSFLGRLAAPPGAEPLPVEERLEGSLATAVWSVLRGAAMVRAHDVGPTVQALALVGAPGGTGSHKEPGSPREATVRRPSGGSLEAAGATGSPGGRGR